MNDASYARLFVCFQFSRLHGSLPRLNPAFRDHPPPSAPRRDQKNLQTNLLVPKGNRPSLPKNVIHF